MRIAVEGCCHDQLDTIYDMIEHIQQINNDTIDLLLICGDFQATRNPDDLLCMAVPPKYRDMKYFYRYYSGEKKAPVLTLVIGGNHEASNHMQELPYGGWLAPNIYYFGYAGIVNVGGVRIGGMSGIYKGKDYHKGHYERPPYDNDALRSAYHTRSLEVFRLKQIQQPVDIMLSHDWPLHAVHAGNVEQLLRWKSDFREEIQQNQLGSPAAQEVLTFIKPTYWFSAHLHCKYPAVIKHKTQPGEDEKVTKFLALDKCLPKRSFLQVFDVPHTKEGPYKLELDPEWMVILKNTDHLLNITSTARYMPGIGCRERYDFRVEKKEIDSLLEDFGGDLTLPENFEKTVKVYDGVSDKKKGKQPKCQVNPQTTLLCQMLALTDPFAVFCGKAQNPDEINIDSTDSDESVVFGDPDSPAADVVEGPAPREQEADSKDEQIIPDTNKDSTNNSVLDTTSSSEVFPTFMHSVSANESGLNDSILNESVPGESCSVPARQLSTMDTGDDGDTNSSNVSTQVNSLSLPEPMNKDSISAPEVTTTAIDRKRCSTEDAAVDIPGDKLSSSVDSSSSATKKFKRRNVAMYSILTNQGTGESDEPT